jgi:hypothetical protein
MSKRYILSAISILIMVALSLHYFGLKVINCSDGDVRAVAIASSRERVYLMRVGYFFIGFPRLEGRAVIVKSGSTAEFGYFTRSGIQFASCS